MTLFPRRPDAGFSTRAIHAGQRPDPSTGAIVPPLSVSAAFAQEEPGVDKDYVHARKGTPLREALERNLASLEGGGEGVAYASGQAAVHAVLSLLSAGDRIVLGADVNAGTRRLVDVVMRRWGLGCRTVDTTDLDALREALAEADTKLVLFESPTEPLLQVTDVAEACRIAHEARALCAVDSTLATPYLQQPLALGADIVIHRTTAYLGGHLDLVGGAVVTRHLALAGELRTLQSLAGAVPGPLETFLVLRGTKTLAVRMERHADNAEVVAAWLSRRPEVARVVYPGLERHPGHAVAARQMRRFGGMVAFELDAPVPTAIRLAASLRLFTLAEGLGGVASLLSQPGGMTHRALDFEARDARGLSDGLLSLSVGLEDAADLTADLGTALERAFAEG